MHHATRTRALCRFFPTRPDSATGLHDRSGTRGAGHSKSATSIVTLCHIPLRRYTASGGSTSLPGIGTDLKVLLGLAERVTVYAALARHVNLEDLWFG